MIWIIVYFVLFTIGMISIYKWNERRVRKDQDKRMQQNIKEALRTLAEEDIRKSNENRNNSKHIQDNSDIK